MRKNWRREMETLSAYRIFYNSAPAYIRTFYAAVQAYITLED